MDQETLKNNIPGGNPVDKAFSDALSEHEVTPSSSSWKGLSSKLLYRELLRFNFRNLPFSYMMIGAGSLVVIGLLLFLLVSPPAENIMPPARSTVANQTPPSPETSFTPVSHLARPVQKEAKIVEETSIPATEPVTVPPALRTGETILTMSGLSCYELKYPYPPEQKKRPRIDRVKNEFVSSISEPTNLDNKTSSFPVPLDKTMNKHYQYFSVGLSINPDISTYKEVNRYSKADYWFRLNLGYNILRFSVQTGIGFGIVNDNGKYGARYIMAGPQPQSPSGVLDTVFYSQILETRDRYYYLDVPVVLGYEFLKHNRFHFTVNAGPGVDFLIGSKRATPNTSVDGATLWQLNDSTPGRQPVNWYILAGITMEYRISNSVSVYFEPLFKYYLTDIFKDNLTDRKHLYTIGLNVGVNLHFGREKIKP